MALSTMALLQSAATCAHQLQQHRQCFVIQNHHPTIHNNNNNNNTAVTALLLPLNSKVTNTNGSLPLCLWIPRMEQLLF
jgi:hypothetical protein